MKQASFLAIAAFAILVSPVYADHKGKVPWVEPPAEGLAQAARTGKPTMLFFSADW